MPRNKYPEETRRKILDVSLRLFSERGYEQTTVLDIVENLGGLTRGAFYHHFKSKEEVILALTEQPTGEIDLIEKIKARTDLSGLEKMRALLAQSMLDTLDNQKRMALNKAVLPLLSNPRFLALQLECNREMAALIRPFFTEGMADGSITPQNPEVLAELAMLLFNFWMLPTVFPWTQKAAMDKLRTVRVITDALGFPVMDEEILASCMRMINALDKN